MGRAGLSLDAVVCGWGVCGCVCGCVKGPKPLLLWCGVLWCVVEQDIVHPEDTVFLDFIQQCLQFDPKRRIQAKDALNHPFFTVVRGLKEVRGLHVCAGPARGACVFAGPACLGGRAICQSPRGRVPALNSIVQVPRPVPAAGDREAGRERGEVPRARTHTAPAFWYVPSRSVDVVVFPPPLLSPLVPSSCTGWR